MKYRVTTFNCGELNFKSLEEIHEWLYSTFTENHSRIAKGHWYIISSGDEVLDALKIEKLTAVKYMESWLKLKDGFIGWLSPDQKNYASTFNYQDANDLVRVLNITRIRDLREYEVVPVNCRWETVLNV